VPAYSAAPQRASLAPQPANAYCKRTDLRLAARSRSVVVAAP
jgi:hypothetical protein